MEGFDPTALEQVARARARRTVGDRIVLGAAAFFALVAVTLLLAVAALRTPRFDAWLMARVQRELAAAGVPATMSMHLELLPPRLVFTDVVVPSLDGSDPALAVPRLEIRPRLAPLLVGRVLIDELRVERPRVRVVLEGGEVRNVALPKTEGKKERSPIIHIPLRTLSVSDATLDLDIEGDLVVVDGFDADARLADDAAVGVVGHLAIDADETLVIRERTVAATATQPAHVAKDDDVLCRLTARLSLDDRELVLRRFGLDGVLDRDRNAATEGTCDLPADDPRWVRVSLIDTSIAREALDGGPLVYRGEGEVRVPLSLANRFADLDAAGIFEASFKLHADGKRKLPELEARLGGHGIALGQFEFVDRLDGDVRIHDDVVASSQLSIAVGQGIALLRDVSVSPFEPGIPMKARLNGDGIDFLALMQALGVSPHPHVAWQVQQLVVTGCEGTLSPLALDGDIEIVADSLGVYDRAVDDPAAKEIVGIGATRIGGRLHIDPDTLVFERLTASFGRSSIRGAQVRIGFAGSLVVDAERVELDLGDVGSVAGLPVSGTIEASVHVHGANYDPMIEVQAKAKALEFAGLALGDVSGLRATAQSLRVDLGTFGVRRGASAYRVRDLRLDFSTGAPLLVSGAVEGESLALRDVLATFHLEDDPRFAAFDATLDVSGDLTVDIGGAGDRCGGGAIFTTLSLRARDLFAFGEHFDRAEAGVELGWTDRLAGLPGATLRIGSFRLEKTDADDASRTVGRLAGALEMAFGGDVEGKFFLEATPLRRFDRVRQLAPALDGFVSGRGTIGGRIDALELSGLFDVEQTLVDGFETGSSHVAWRMRQQRDEPSSSPLTRCELPVPRPFDRDAYLSRTGPSGLHRIDGTLFGGQLVVEEAQLTVEDEPMLIGRFEARDLDVARVALPMFRSAPVSEIDAVESIEDADRSGGGTPWSGRVSGTIRVDEFRKSELAKAKVAIDLSAFRLSTMGLVLAKGQEPVSLEVGGGSLKLTPTHVKLTPADESAGTVVGLALAVESFSAQGNLSGALDLPVTSIATFSSLDPRLRRAKGSLSGAIALRGVVSSPSVNGAFHVEADEIPLGDGVPPLSDVRADFKLLSDRFELARATARTSGGELDASGAVFLAGYEPARAEGVVNVRGVRFSPVDGTRASIDGRLEIAVPSFRKHGERARLGGEVTLRDAEYVRSINLVTGLGGDGNGRRTAEHYDPANDWVDLDVQVKTGTPIRIRNNLVEVMLQAGAVGLRVTGTNQRFGLRGELFALQGGRFHFPTNDFDVRAATVRFDDPTRVAPMVDVAAVTEYRRFSDRNAVGTGTNASGAGGSQSSSTWRIDLRATGDANDLRLAMTSDPPLAQDDIVLLLTMGITRTELDQLRSGAAIGALGALGTLSGADRAVRDTIRVLDDFRLGAGYSPRAARTVPQVTIGKRLGKSVRATVTTGISESSDVRSSVEWAFGSTTSAQVSYDNYMNAASSSAGNVGLDLRWHLEFE
jgi:translocation and assembly module TamB